MTTPAPTTTRPSEPAKTADPAADAADKAAAKVAAEKQAELDKQTAADAEKAKSASQDENPSKGNPDKTTAGTNPKSDAAQNNAPLPEGPANSGIVSSGLPEGYKKLKQFFFILEDANTPDDHTLFGLNGIPFRVSDLRSLFPSKPKSDD